MLSRLLIIAIVCFFVCTSAQDQTESEAEQSIFDSIEDASLKTFVKGIFSPDASICRFGGYDYSYLYNPSTDYIGYDTSRTYNYYMNLCGAVSYAPCRSLNGSASICQETNTNPQTYTNLGSFANGFAWSWNSPSQPQQGVSLSFNNGVCSNGNTATSQIQLICSDQTSTIFNVAAENNCAYSFSIRVKCPAPPSTNCNFGGYDFSSLMNSADYTTYDSGNNDYYMAMCGAVKNAACVGSNFNSSLCIVSSNGQVTDLGHYVANSGQWSFMDYNNPQKGLLLTFVNSAQTCYQWQYKITAKVQLFCSSSTQPATFAVASTGTCQYTFSLNVYCATINYENIVKQIQQEMKIQQISVN